MPLNTSEVYSVHVHVSNQRPSSSTQLAAAAVALIATKPEKQKEWAKKKENKLKEPDYEHTDTLLPYGNDDSLGMTALLPNSIPDKSSTISHQTKHVDDAGSCSTTMQQPPRRVCRVMCESLAIHQIIYTVTDLSAAAGSFRQGDSIDK